MLGFPSTAATDPCFSYSRCCHLYRDVSQSSLNGAAPWPAPTCTYGVYLPQVRLNMCPSRCEMIGPVVLNRGNRVVSGDISWMSPLGGGAAGIWSIWSEVARDAGNTLRCVDSPDPMSGKPGLRILESDDATGGASLLDTWISF